MKNATELDHWLNAAVAQNIYSWNVTAKKKKHQQQHIEPSGEPSNDTAKEY